MTTVFVVEYEGDGGSAELVEEASLEELARRDSLPDRGEGRYVLVAREGYTEREHLVAGESEELLERVRRKAGLAR